MVETFGDVTGGLLAILVLLCEFETDSASACDPSNGLQEFPSSE